MLPINNDGLLLDFEEAEQQTSKTFKLDFNTNRCYGSIDGIEALKQAIFLIQSIERYEYLIYSWNTGLETQDLIGKPVSYVMSEIKRRIPDCLLQDDRITAVDNFEFVQNKKKLHLKYTAYTIYGEIDIEREVDY